jgi:hypothetical protein
MRPPAFSLVVLVFLGLLLTTLHTIVDGRQSFAFHGDTEEKVNILLTPRSASVAPMPKHARVVRIHGTPEYECIVPPSKPISPSSFSPSTSSSSSTSSTTASTSDTTHPSPSTTSTPHPRVTDPTVDAPLLETRLRRDCVLVSTGGWFVAEVCPFQHVRQYHAEQGKGVTMEFFLGHYNESASHARQARGEAVQVYDRGTTCDLTGRPRSATVRFYCDRVMEHSPLVHKMPAGMHMVDEKARLRPEDIPRFSVTEPQTCQYDIVFYARHLCDAKAHPPTSSPSPSSTSSTSVPQKDKPAVVDVVSSVVCTAVGDAALDVDALMDVDVDLPFTMDVDLDMDMHVPVDGDDVDGTAQLEGLQATVEQLVEQFGVRVAGAQERAKEALKAVEERAAEIRNRNGGKKLMGDDASSQSVVSKDKAKEEKRKGRKEKQGEAVRVEINERGEVVFVMEDDEQ